VTASEYEAIAHACDSLLTATDATLETVAISWLHVHNEHPVNLGKYDALEKQRSFVKRGLRAARRSRSVSLLHSLLRHGPTAWSRPTHRADVLIVSHLLSEAHAGSSTDFYFGVLTDTLEDHGISTVLALRNHTAVRPSRLAAAWAGQHVPRVVLAGTGTPTGELRLRSRMQNERKRLIAAGCTSESALVRAVRETAAAEAVSFGSRSDLRVYYQIFELVARLQPSSIVITFEGHGWERLAFRAARAARPGIRCIGYHHTILFPRQHAIRRPLGSGFDPDVLLTVGSITQQE
jgi:hypothetical protein